MPEGGEKDAVKRVAMYLGMLTLAAGCVAANIWRFPSVCTMLARQTTPGGRLVATVIQPHPSCEATHSTAKKKLSRLDVGSEDKPHEFAAEKKPSSPIPSASIRSSKPEERAGPAIDDPLPRNNGGVERLSEPAAAQPGGKASKGTPKASGSSAEQTAKNRKKGGAGKKAVAARSATKSGAHADDPNERAAVQAVTDRHRQSQSAVVSETAVSQPKYAANEDKVAPAAGSGMVPVVLAEAEPLIVRLPPVDRTTVFAFSQPGTLADGSLPLYPRTTTP
ncbi:MAG: hypothetical protein ACOY3P_01240 [Planctomycetota bacterium]